MPHSGLGHLKGSVLSLSVMASPRKWNPNRRIPAFCGGAIVVHLDRSCANLQQTGTVSRPYNMQMVPARSLPIGRILKILLAISLWAGNALAQENPPPPAPAGNGSQSVPDPAAAAQTAAETTAETTKRCWQLLTDSVQDAKHTETGTQALNALSSLGWSAHADGLIAAAMK